MSDIARRPHTDVGKWNLASHTILGRFFSFLFFFNLMPTRIKPQMHLSSKSIPMNTRLHTGREHPNTPGCFTDHSG